MATISSIKEGQLSEGLQPIRYFFLAQCLYFFLDIGIQQALSIDKNQSTHALAKLTGLSEKRLVAFLEYLANEGYVILDSDNETVSLSEKGHLIEPFYPWYKLLVGGYAQSFMQLGDVLADETKYANRNSFNVGIGSCGISQFDAIPITLKLLNKIDQGFSSIVDIGCGDGRYLIELCKLFPAVKGIGIETKVETVQFGNQLAVENQLGDRVKIIHGNETNLIDVPPLPDPFCFITAFVLQEILEQSGREAVLKLLLTIFSTHPDSSLIVIEVDNRKEDKEMLSNGLGQAYYNAYYLIHQITQQKLETKIYWEQLFIEANLDIIAVEYPDPDYDSLQLKMGFLLRKSC
jgi:2-ketoarginine methyltransferase